jgi:hypothetical protein
MGRVGGVPGGAENGSPCAGTEAAGSVLGGGGLFLGVVLVGLLAAATTCGCLSGDAQPIVALAVDSGSPPEAGSSASACPAGAPLSLFYWPAQAAADASSIDFLFKVANNTGASVPLSSLAVRYYFANELTTWQTSIYYAGECCGASRSGFTADVAVTVNAIATPMPGADHYLEVTFDSAAGVLADGDSVQIEVGFYAPEHDQDLNQANDYSFIAGSTATQAEWNLCPTQCAQFESCVITVYENGALVWGTPP